MLKKLFSSRSRETVAAACVPHGTRVYAVGDIHGRLDLLDELLTRIEADHAARPSSDTQIIFLGDLIDRGPDSSGVIERLRSYAGENGRCRFLLGNHEEVFLKVLGGDRRALAFFNRIGGRNTILSYGISQADYDRSDYPELLELTLRHVPSEHVEFLQSFEDLIVLGDYAFAHAGVRPGVPLASQAVSDLRWIRDDFLSHKGRLEKIVVHGHTVADQVETLAHRIGLDTGAFSSGILSAMGFECDRRWVLQTGNP